MNQTSNLVSQMIDDRRRSPKVGRQNSGICNKEIKLYGRLRSSFDPMTMIAEESPLYLSPEIVMARNGLSGSIAIVRSRFYGNQCSEIKISKHPIIVFFYNISQLVRAV